MASRWIWAISRDHAFHLHPAAVLLGAGHLLIRDTAGGGKRRFTQIAPVRLIYLGSEVCELGDTFQINEFAGVNRRQAGSAIDENAAGLIVHKHGLAGGIKIGHHRLQPDGAFGLGSRDMRNFVACCQRFKT